MTTLLLFDIDGTLLLTGGAGKIAFERAYLELFGAGNVWGNTHPDGRTDPDLIDEISMRALGRQLNPDENTRLIDSYHTLFREAIQDMPNFRLMPGIPGILETLSGKRGMLLGIATGNFETAARIKLEKGGLSRHFSFGGYASDSRDRFELTRIACERGLKKNGGPIPSERIFVIGDTIHDVRAAKKLGVRSVAVATGRTTAEQLRKENPDYCFQDLTQADDFLQEIA